MPEKMSANRARDSRETVRRKRRERTKENLEFYECIRDIVSHPAVLEMKKYYQHCDTDCYEHCLDVAYNNYKICKKLGLDARSAARGGMLHDLFLYDWREHSKKTGDRLHAITHPITAYRNACKYFHLNKGEKEVITKHMWPVSVIPPRYPETYVICLTDKYCGSREIMDHYAKVLQNKYWGKPFAWFLKRIPPVIVSAICTTKERRVVCKRKCSKEPEALRIPVIWRSPTAGRLLCTPDPG